VRSLGALAEELGTRLPEGADAGHEVRGLAWDSRCVRPGEVFFALPGRREDGHAFIAEAVSRGATAVVCEHPPADLGVPVLCVADGRAALARAAALFYDYPSRKLRAVGVTGTDGKSTVVHLLRQLLPACEALTTVDMADMGTTCVTTPEAPDLQRIAAEAVERGASAFAFEASSIGLDQRRVDGMELAAAVFTGLGRDHLDYHGSLEKYLAAKLKLFGMLGPGGKAVLGAGEPHRSAVRDVCDSEPITFGVGVGDVRAENVKLRRWGGVFSLVTPGGRHEVSLPVPGEHNLRNALAAAACSWALGEPIDDTAARLGRVSLPPGRWTRIRHPRGAEAVVDYAHTPEALGVMLSALRPHARRLIAVFGANGEADPGKRPLMGRVAARWADLVLLTADNPKSEDPHRIARQIAAGFPDGAGQWETHVDRRTAVRRAWELADLGDIILVAGKGHERLQWTADGPQPYSDLDVLCSLGGTPAERLD